MIWKESWKLRNGKKREEKKEKYFRMKTKIKNKEANRDHGRHSIEARRKKSEINKTEINKEKG